MLEMCVAINDGVPLLRVLLSLPLCVLAGCQKLDEPSVTAARPPLSTSSAPFPVEVTDFLGRRVRVPQRPQRIVSLSPRNTELLFAIAADERVVGVTTYCNYPPQAAELAKVGGFSTSSLSVETIVSLEPDLIVAADDIQRPVIDDLERLGYPVLSLDAESLDALLEEIAILGRVTECSAAAERLIRGMQDRVAHFERAVAQIPREDRVTVYFEIWDQPLTAAGPASFIGEVIQLAGGINLLDDPEARYVPIGHEFVLHGDPDFILIPDDSVSIDQVRGRLGWNRLQAVKNSRVQAVNSDLVSRCGPRLIQALEEMAAVLYPDRFGTTRFETRSGNRGDKPSQGEVGAP